MNYGKRNFEKLSALPQVEAIALGGSRANGVFDEKSDYDVYVYVTDNIDNGVRENILAPYCSQMEIGNHYWEFEDNIILKDGVPMDIIYRPMDKFDKFISYTVFEHHANHGYTTCFWHNIITSQIVYDPSGKYAEIKKEVYRSVSRRTPSKCYRFKYEDAFGYFAVI